MSVKITKFEWAAILVVAFLIWWPLAVAVSPFHHVPAYESGHTAAGNAYGEPQPDSFWTIKIGDLLTLVILTVQAGIFAVQAYLAHSQRGVMNIQAETSARQADASELQSKIALKQEELLFQQKEIMRQTFLLSHRPHLRIHSVRLRAPKSNIPSEDQPIRAWFVLVNAGMSEARIVSNLVLLEYLDPEDRLHLSITRQNGVIPNLTFEVGEERTLATSSDTNIDMAWSSFVHSLPRDDDPKRLHFHGWIIYNDAAERRRTLYFCSVYDEATGRFKPIDDPEANCTY